MNVPLLLEKGCGLVSGGIRRGPEGLLGYIPGLTGLWWPFDLAVLGEVQGISVCTPRGLGSGTVSPWRRREPDPHLRLHPSAARESCVAATALPSCAGFTPSSWHELGPPGSSQLLCEEQLACHPGLLC